MPFSKNCKRKELHNLEANDANEIDDGPVELND